MAIVKASYLSAFAIASFIYEKFALDCNIHSKAL